MLKFDDISSEFREYFQKLEESWIFAEIFQILHALHDVYQVFSHVLHLDVWRNPGKSHVQHARP